MLGVRVLSLNARNGTEVDSALKGISKKDVDGVLVGGDILFLVKGADIARTIHDAGLPAVFPWKSYHDYGALVSYGVNVKAVGVRAALYVAKILKGAKPVDLPVEESSQFELVVDLREARRLKIEVPQSVLIRATEVMR
jgi:putative ABC transport system substrate-binding protein